MWALCDFTEANGPPGSSPAATAGPRTGNPPSEVVQATMPAGSVLIYHGGLWHGGAPTPRPAPAGVILEQCRGCDRRRPSWWRCRPSGASCPNGCRTARLQRLPTVPRLRRRSASGEGAALVMTDDTIPGLAEEYWEAQPEASPLFATYMGDHRYDDLVDELSVETEQAPGHVDRLGQAAAPGRHPRDRRGTRDLLLHELDDALQRPAAGRNDLGPDGGRARRPAECAASSTPRARARGRWPWSAPGTTATCWPRRPSAGARAWPRVAPRPASTSSAPSTRSRYLASPLADDLFVNLAGPEGWDGLDAWRAELTQIVAGELRPASPATWTCCGRAAAPVPARRPAGSCTCPTGTSCTRRSSRSTPDCRSPPGTPPGGAGRGGLAGGRVPGDRRAAVGHEGPGRDLRPAHRRREPALPRRGRDPGPQPGLPRRRHRGHGRLVRHRARGPVRAHPGARLPGGGRGRRVLTPPHPTAAGPASTTSTCATPPGAPGGDRVDLLPRGDPRPPPPAGHRHRAHVAARVPAAVLGPHRLRGGLGALHRAAGRRDGPVRERPRPAGHAGR